MTDLEITKACAKAMGYPSDKPLAVTCDECGEFGIPYDPLKNDAQAMALVKKFGLWLRCDRGRWCVMNGDNEDFENGWDRFVYGPLSADLNRAICLCVARMHKEKV